MTPVDDLVYALPGGADYLAPFDDGELVWLRWPAHEHGWAERKTGKEADAEQAEELPPRLARLALRLSGVPEEVLR